MIHVSIKGYAAGGWYQHSGAAAEYVCLPQDPNLITNAVSTNPLGLTTHIYGAEYECFWFQCASV